MDRDSEPVKTYIIFLYHINKQSLATTWQVFFFSHLLPLYHERYGWIGVAFWKSVGLSVLGIFVGISIIRLTDWFNIRQHIKASFTNIVSDIFKILLICVSSSNSSA